MLTAQRLVERSLRAFGDRPAVIDGDRTFTYSALRERSARLANALIGHGVSRDDTASILLPNEGRFVEIDLACMRIGVTRVAMSSRLSADECQYIVAHSCSKVLFTTPALYDSLDVAQLPELKLILLLGEVKARSWNTGRERDYESVLGDAQDNLLPVDPVGPDHPAFIMYTSGTTGRPKGATHSHGGRVAAMVNMLAGEIRADSRSAMLHCGPLSHGSGSKLLTFLALGARNVVLSKFEPGQFAQAIERHGCTHSFMVPTMLQMLLDGGEPVRLAVRKMHQVSFGGAPITDALFERSIDGFGPILTQVYGSCEAPHPITVMQPDDYTGLTNPGVLAQSAGRASPGSDIQIVDDEGNTLPAGSEGELWVRGTHVMRGYWRDEIATADAFGPGRWYKTGDIAAIDEAGFVSFRDRKRDLIITGGLNVYPSEVERVLAEHPRVKEAAVVAFPDDRWGESILACVVAADGDPPSEADIIDWAGQYLASYKKPRKVVFMSELPKGSTNKVLKRELKAQYWEGRTRRIN